MKKLLQQKEGQCFDRKSILVEPKALAVSVVAFANADGGTILIGLESGPESGPESIFCKSLALLHSGALSKSELAVALGHKSISGKLNLRIRQMLDGGLIERTLPEKPNSRLQKYRLTPRGRAMLRKE